MTNIWMKVKEMISMRDLAEEFGLLHKKDRGIKCPICQYENKTQPPIYYGDDYFFCHKCKESGDIFKLHRLINGGNHLLALHQLSKRVGIEVKQDVQSRLLMARSESYSKFADKYSELPANIKAILNERGLKDDFIEKKRIGWIPKDVKK